MEPPAYQAQLIEGVKPISLEPFKAGLAVCRPASDVAKMFSSILACLDHEVPPAIVRLIRRGLSRCCKPTEVHESLPFRNIARHGDAWDSNVAHIIPMKIKSHLGTIAIVSIMLTRRPARCRDPLSYCGL